MQSTDPKNIDVSLSSGVRIDWGDGHHSEYTLEYLRENCPCALCTSGTHKSAAPASPFPMYKKVLKMDGVEPIGRYALQFKWNDGHSSGIYSFEHLREICPCAQCRSGKS
jgi:DUF971 family protein